MKVRMTVTVTVDPALWAHEYGITEAEVREDVRTLVATTLQNTYALETLADEVKVA